MSKWIAEFELEDGDTMPEHMDLEYKGARIDFHCRPLEQEPTTKNDLGVDCISRTSALDSINWAYSLSDAYQKINDLPSVTPQLSSGLDKNSKKLEKNFGELDCISRADVHDMLENLPITVYDKWFNWLQKACMRLAELPSVTPQEPKTGHWKPYLKEGLRYQCSACDSRFDTPWEYCPHCGAKMAESEEE